MSAVVGALGAGLLLLACVPVVPPLERLDRVLFAKLAGGDRAVEGRGTFAEPRMLEETIEPAAPAVPVVLTLEEDPEQWFEEMPPPPSDVAVVLSRLHAAGVRHLGIGYPLQWDSGDTLAVETMRAMMDRFDGLALGFPLKDGTAGQPVAAPFLRASVASDEVLGRGDDLPVVNGIRGAAPELGGERTLAGFTRLVNEKEEERRAYLLARWGDRVVFSLPLVVEILRRGIGFDEVRIEPGREIRLGEAGPRIAIDFRGRAVPPEELPELGRIPLSAVIARTLPEDFPPAGRPVFVADGRELGPKEDLAWLEGLGGEAGLIARAPVRMALLPVPRPNGLLEILAVIVVAGFSAWVMRMRHAEWRALTALACTALVLGLLVGLIRGPSLSPPPLALAVVPAVAWIVVEFARWTLRVEIMTAPVAGTSPAVAEVAAPRKKARKKRRR